MPTPESTPPPSLHWERAVRSEIRRCLAEQRPDEALAAFELLLRDAYPRQLDIFRQYGELCLRTGRFRQGFEILWTAAESIERRSYWYGASAWLSLAELAPTDVRPLRRAALAGRHSQVRSVRLVQPGLRAGYARLVAAGLLAEAEALQADVDFPLAVPSVGRVEAPPMPLSSQPAELDDHAEELENELADAARYLELGFFKQSGEIVRRVEQALRNGGIADEGARTSLEDRIADLSGRIAIQDGGPLAVGELRFKNAADPRTWRTIAKELSEAGETGAEYATVRALHAERQPGCLSGPPRGEPTDTPQTRVLLFPNTRVGTVQLRPWQSGEAWRPSVVARGQVLLPAGWEARLSFDEDQPRALEVLARLGAQDLQALALVDQRVDDHGLALLGTLTGLH